MTRATVWVEANVGGDILVEHTRRALEGRAVPGSCPLPVDVRAYYGRSPLPPKEPGGHDVYFHAEDGSSCIWVTHDASVSDEGYWFIPYDVGGEGVGCEKEHHAPSDCLHDPKTYFFGIEPALGLSSDNGGLDPDRLNSFTIGAFVERIYVAPWVDMRAPIHAQWKHEPTGAVAVVCSPFDVPGEMTDELGDVTCADCLRAIVRIYARKR